MARPCGVFFASLEEDPRDLIVRIAECAVGREEPSEVELEWFLFEFGQRLKLWGQIGQADYREVFALIRLLAKQGVRHAIIDSLFCLNVSPKDMEAQQQFAADLATTARLSGCHIHLVAHPRKPQQSEQDVDLNDVAGSADLGRIVETSSSSSVPKTRRPCPRTCARWRSRSASSATAPAPQETSRDGFTAR
jgi:hypothetical protein